MKPGTAPLFISLVIAGFGSSRARAVTIDDLAPRLDALDVEADAHELKLDALQVKGTELVNDSLAEIDRLALQEAVVDVLGSHLDDQDAAIAAIRVLLEGTRRTAVERALAACASSCDERPASSAAHQALTPVACHACASPRMMVSRAQGGLLDDALDVVALALPVADDPVEAAAYYALAQDAAARGDGELAFHLACRAYRAIACAAGAP
jgi:hypothetical protein